MTLYLFTGDNPMPNPAIVIPLCDIKEYRFETQGDGRVIVKLNSGTIVDSPIISAPKTELLNKFREASTVPRFRVQS
jgi:hypothetical protein